MRRPRSRAGGAGRPAETEAAAARHSAASAEARASAHGDETERAPAEDSRSFWQRNRKRVSGGALAALCTAGFFYFVLPRIVGLGPTLRALRSGNTNWLLLAVGLEACSFLGDMVTFYGVFAARGTPIGWRRTVDVRLAGAAATKLFAAAGAGGIALTVWALRGSGLSGADVADGMVCYEMITYGIYASAMAIAGYGLWFGVFSGPHPIGLTLVPACIATGVILVVLSMLKLHEPAERFLQRRAERSTGKAAKRWTRAATLPRTIDTGLRAALAMVRRRDPSVLGALAYWGFDIGTLWASFRAFGHSPPGAVLVEGYYLGTLGTALPLPGGIGGVEGGMIGAFIGFGVKAPLATIAVLGYRTISYWLPTIPGVLAYFRLRHDLGNDAAGAGQTADQEGAGE